MTTTLEKTDIGIVKLNDDHLPELWEIIKSYPDFFSDGVNVNSLDAFSMWFENFKDNAVVAMSDGKLVGCSYLDAIQDKFASVNIIFQRHNVSVDKKIELGREGLRMFFKAYDLQMIYGITRSTNFACLKFMKNLGFIFTDVLKKYKKVNGQMVDYIYGSVIRSTVT